MGATTEKKKEPASEGGRYTRSTIARDGPRPLHRGKKSPPPFADQGKRKAGATSKAQSPATVRGRYIGKKEPASLRRSGQAEAAATSKAKIARDSPRPLHRGKKSPPPFADQGKRKAGAT